MQSASESSHTVTSLLHRCRKNRPCGCPLHDVIELKCDVYRNVRASFSFLSIPDQVVFRDGPECWCWGTTRLHFAKTPITSPPHTFYYSTTITVDANATKTFKQRRHHSTANINQIALTEAEINHVFINNHVDRNTKRRVTGVNHFQYGSRRPIDQSKDQRNHR